MLTAFPPFLDPLWRGLVWAALGWGLVLLVAAVLRRRLARDVVAAVVLVLGIVLSAVVTGSRWDVVSRLAYIGLPPVYPSGVVVVAACLAVTSPHVARPFRELGRWLPTGQLAGWCSSAARRWPVASPRSRRPGRR